MRVFKTKVFDRWAMRERVSDAVLGQAIQEMVADLLDADLGGHVYKKRIRLPGRGKRGGARTLVAFRSGRRAFFMYGFAKNERANIDDQTLKALRLLAKELLGYSPQRLSKAIDAGELIEVLNDE